MVYKESMTKSYNEAAVTSSHSNPRMKAEAPTLFIQLIMRAALGSGGGKGGGKSKYGADFFFFSVLIRGNFPSVFLPSFLCCDHMELFMYVQGTAFSDGS